MSKFLKVVVNIILTLAILVAGGLLIPPFAGVTTVIVDDVDMDTNLAKGSVTYALDLKGSPKEGSKVLVSEGDGRYIYEVKAVNGETCTLEDTRSTDGTTQEMTLGSTAKKVLFTVPFIGYVSMALRTTEGLIIVGLAVIFVIILFILAEIWKKDDEDDDDEDDEDEDDEADEPEAEDEEDEEESEPQMSRRERKKAEKAAAKEEKAAAKAAAKAAKKAKKSRKGEEEASDTEFDEEETFFGEETGEEAPKAEEAAAIREEDQELFKETENILAADIASMLGEEAAPEVLPEESAEPVMEEKPVFEEEEKPEEKKLAMPVYTKEELLKKAQEAGDEPKVVEDEISGITLLDYSDIL